MIKATQIIPAIAEKEMSIDIVRVVIDYETKTIFIEPKQGGRTGRNLTPEIETIIDNMLISEMTKEATYKDVEKINK